MLSYDPCENSPTLEKFHPALEEAQWPEFVSHYSASAWQNYSVDWNLRRQHCHSPTITPSTLTRHLPSFSAAYNPDAHGFSDIAYIYHRSYDIPIPWGSSFTDDNIFGEQCSSPAFGSAVISSSSTDLTLSDGAQTPDASKYSPLVTKSHPNIPHNACSTNNELVFSGHAPLFINLGYPSSATFPFAGSRHTDCSMKDLQIRQDYCMNEELSKMHAQPGLGNNSPEALDLLKHIPSPADSGLGTSVDNMQQIEEECDSNTTPSSDIEPIPESILKSREVRRRTSAMRPTRRGSSTSSGTPIIDPAARVHKNIASRKHHQSQHKSSSSNIQTSERSPPAKIQYVCRFYRYGCRAVFANKNEWKRHNRHQHLQLGFYRCDQGSCVADGLRRHNDFNRKDLFTSHSRRMHAPWSKKGNNKTSDYFQASKKLRNAFDKEMDQVRERCWKSRRQPPMTVNCVFCNATFEEMEGGDCQSMGKAWDDCMDHISRHYERDGLTIEDEVCDEELEAWALQEKIIKKVAGTDDLYMLVGYVPGIGKMGRRKSNTKLTLSLRKSSKLEQDQDQDRDMSDATKTDESDDADEDDNDVNAEAEDVETGSQSSDEDAEGEEE